MRKLLGIAIVLLTANVGFAQNPKLGRDLRGIDPGSNVDVIVQFKHSPTAAHHQMVRNHGGTLKHSFQSVKGAVYTVPASELEGLAKNPEVAYISPDRPLRARLDNTAAAVNAAVAWQSYGLTGTGIAVAVIDSGISDHPDLHAAPGAPPPAPPAPGAPPPPPPGKSGPGRIIYQQSFVTGPGPNDPNDHYGHGEHVAGILGGNGSQSNCPQCTRHLVGIAPNVSLIDFRVLDQSGAGTDSQVIAAIEQAIALQSYYNIRVINLSLGRPVYESYTLDPLCQAVEAAWNAGIVVVTAAGNDGRDNSVGESGYGTIEAPGNDPLVITVGAMKTMGTPARYDDLIASYSSKGPTAIDHVVKPDIVAPGNLVVSLLAPGTTLVQEYPTTQIPQSYYSNQAGPGANGNSNQYFQLSGTSMATPVVAGAAALLLQRNPNLTPDQVKARLMRTAYKSFPTYSIAIDPTTGIAYTSYYDVFTVGAGYLDIQAALADSSLASGTAISPSITFDSVTQSATMVFDSRAIWGTSGIWATSAIWGLGVVNSTRAIWGTSAIWAQSSTSAFSAIWGASAIWAQSSTNASSVDFLGEN